MYSSAAREVYSCSPQAGLSWKCKNDDENGLFTMVGACANNPSPSNPRSLAVFICPRFSPVQLQMGSKSGQDTLQVTDLFMPTSRLPVSQQPAQQLRSVIEAEKAAEVARVEAAARAAREAEEAAKRAEEDKARGKNSVGGGVAVAPSTQLLWRAVASFVYPLHSLEDMTVSGDGMPGCVQGGRGGGGLK